MHNVQDEKRETALETSRRVRFLVGAFLFALFAGWALYVWIQVAYVSIGLLLLAAVGPVAYVIGQSLVDAKREESRGRIEAAKLRQKRVVASY